MKVKAGTSIIRKSTVEEIENLKEKNPFTFPIEQHHGLVIKEENNICEVLHYKFEESNVKLCVESLDLFLAGMPILEKKQLSNKEIKAVTDQMTCFMKETHKMVMDELKKGERGIVQKDAEYVLDFLLDEGVISIDDHIRESANIEKNSLTEEQYNLMKKEDYIGFFKSLKL